MRNGKDVDTTGWHPYEVRKRPQVDRYVIVQHERLFHEGNQLNYGYTVCRILDRKRGTAITADGFWIEWKKWKGYGTCWAYLDELVVKN